MMHYDVRCVIDNLRCCQTSLAEIIWEQLVVYTIDQV